MTKMPETIWAEDEHGDDHEDQGSYGSWDCRNAYGYVHEYIRADISQAAIAAAIEMAAKRNELTVRSIKEALDYREWEAAREIAMKGPPAIRALATPAQTDALEAVRLEAERAGYERMRAKAEKLAGAVNQYVRKHNATAFRTADYHENCDCLRCLFDRMSAALTELENTDDRA